MFYDQLASLLIQITNFQVAQFRSAQPAIQEGQNDLAVAKPVARRMVNLLR